MQFQLKRWFGGCALLWCFLWLPLTAQALPSFARQTGSQCVSCHIAGVGWHLTPHGIMFKLTGYTEGDKQTLPLSAQLRVSHNDRELPNTQDANRLDEVSVFLAGRIAPKLGAYVKVAKYDDPFNTGAPRNTELQILDLRFADSTEVGGRDLVWGLTLNNQPGITDPLDANQAWGFPAIGSTGSLFNPNTAPTLARRVLGATAYALLDSHWYAELGGYRAMSRAAQDRLGQDPENDPGRIAGVAPYWRLAYLHDFKTQFIGAGLYGMNVKRQLTLLNPAPRQTARLGADDSLNAVGFDAMYEYLGNREHIVQLRFNHVREKVRYGAPLVAFGFTAPDSGTTREQTLTATYVFKQAYALTVARTDTKTSLDLIRNYPFGRTDSKARYMEAAWTPFGQEDSWLAPWANLRIAATWFRFDKFNGGTQQVFGPYSPNSRDLDSFQLYAQVTF